MAKWSHPQGWLEKIRSSTEEAKREYGEGHWEVNVSGDMKSAVSWKTLDESFAGDAAKRSKRPYCRMWFGNLEAAGIGVRKSLMAVDDTRIKPQEAEVDFHNYCCTLTVPAFDAGVGDEQKRRLPLRRVGKTQFPTDGDAEKHPFYLLQAVKIEASATWLTTEFFYQAFAQAIQQNGGQVPANVPSLFNETFNHDWMETDVSECEPERRGGVLYRTPAGWKRFALDVRKYGDDMTWLGMTSGGNGEWAVAYHGTSMDVVPLIVNNGFKVGSGNGAAACLDTRTGKETGKGIYCTPNLRTVECYANGCEDKGSEQKKAATTLRGKDGKEHTLFFALQCRVNPKAIRRPTRHFSLCNDEEVMGIDGTFEWVINDPKDIRPYAILVRDKQGSDYRTLSQLIAPVKPFPKWNQDHKPLAFKAFDHIPGRTVSDAELQKSFLWAFENIK